MTSNAARPRPQPKVGRRRCRADQKGLGRSLGWGPPASESSRSATILRPMGPFVAVALFLTVMLAPIPLLAQSSAEAEEADDRAESVMPGLAREFRALEKGLASGDARAARSHAEALAACGAGITLVRPHRNGDARDLFDAGAGRVRSLATEIVELADAGEVSAARQALEELRGACVACHARFRAEDFSRGSLPARDNTVSGEVTIVAADGSRRVDRSNVVVFLEGEPLIRSWDLPRRNPRITQVDVQFEPRVLPVLVGSTVEFPNDDVIYHNVFSLSATQPFDLGAYGPGKNSSLVFTRTGLVQVYCNMHPQMTATIVVLGNPCFGVTDRLGCFALSGVPDGSYVLRTWHEHGGETRQEIVLADSAGARRSIVVQETGVTIKHKNKFGRPYREKY